jgi:hypothetical protein
MDVAPSARDFSCQFGAAVDGEVTSWSHWASQVKTNTTAEDNPKPTQLNAISNLAHKKPPALLGARSMMRTQFCPI